MAIEQPLSEVVRGFRAAARLTQAELAERADISERAVSDIERGLRSRVYPITAQALADALGLVGEQRVAFDKAARAGRVPVRRGDGGIRSADTGSAEWRAMRRDPLIGRAAEVARTVAALRFEDARLVTVTGVGGIGKSRLAAEVCALFAAERVLWVALADLQAPSTVSAAVAQVLGLPAEVSATALAEALDAEPTLLILDTFERLLVSAGYVAGLLDNTTGLCVLVTSRAPLRIRGERETPLRPLEPDPANELFRRRAAAVSGGAPLDDRASLALVEEITARLAGLPLAIELAAARLRHMSLSALQSELARPLDVLTEGGIELPPRQQTLRAALRWSYDLLDEPERRLFRRVGRLVGAWTLEDARALCDEGASRDAVLSSLSRLCEQGLMQPEEGGGELRWRLLDPVREFAWEQCVADGEGDSVARNHARHFLEIGAAASAGLLGLGQAQAHTTLRRMMPNVRLALDWAISGGDADVALGLATSMWMCWRMEGAFTEARHWLDSAIALPTASESGHWADGLWAGAWLAHHQRDFDTAAAYGALLQQAATASGDPLQRRNAATVLGELALAAERFDEAILLLENAVELAVASGAPWHHATSLLNLGTALLHSGHPDRAEALLAGAVAEHQQVGDQHFVARSTIEWGYAAIVRGDLDTAQRRFVAGLRRFLDVGERWGVAEAVMALAVVAAARGDAETAALLAGAAESAYTELAAQLIAPDAALAARILGTARSSQADVWDAAAADGRTLPIDDAAAIALDRVHG
jgi:predicted ATPase/transcriptional regulator with XRE-family HTH domain